MTKEYKLTTIDNPFSPFTQFDEWNAFDVAQGYNTLAYLGRVVSDSEFFGEDDIDLARDEAIDEIIQLNVLGIYRKVTRYDYDPP